MDASTPPAELKKSEKFCHDTSADVTFISSDNVIFHIQRKYIEASANGFPLAEVQTNNEMVPLVEKSTILELLFHFMYPQRCPDLNGVEFKVLAALAEASEKYEVFSAMGLCNVLMRNTLPIQALSIVNYADRHGYTDLVDEAALSLIGTSLDEIVRHFPQHLLAKWVLYRTEWLKALSTAFVFEKQWHPDARPSAAAEPCSWQSYYSAVLLNLEAGGVGALRRLDQVFPQPSAVRSNCCATAIRHWRLKVERTIGDIPKFADARVNRFSFME